MTVNKVKNRVIVESSSGDRAFLLLEGDIFKERAEVYVFNAYQNDGGELIEDLKGFYGLEKITETPFFYASHNISVKKVKLENGRMILILHTNLVEYEKISINQYKYLIDVVFTSFVAIETMGVKLDNIAFPVLFRNGISAIYPEAIKVLVEKSSEWLKKSENTRAVKMVLYEEKDAEIWSENLNNVLGRRAIDSRDNAIMIQFKHKALTILQLMSKKLPYWQDTLLPLRDSLQLRDFRPEVVAAFSRKLLEVFCIELCKDKGNFSSSLEDALKYIRLNSLLNDLDIQNLYQIRSFGNPSIHRSETVIGPKSMNDRDVAILLISLCKLLDMIYDFANATQPYRFNKN